MGTRKRGLLATTLAFSLLAAALPLASPRPVEAAGSGAIALTGLNTAYQQDFDTLASTAGTAHTALPTGWYLAESGNSARNNDAYAVSTGSDTAGDVFSFGSTGSSDRAFGTLFSGTLTPIIGASFTNNTGATIDALAVSYTGEMWRAGVASRGAADRLDFQVSGSATSLTTGTWTHVDALDYGSSNTSTTTGLKDGNSSDFRTSVTSVITGLSIADGATFWIRWTDLDISPGADDGLAVDDFSLTPQDVDAAPFVSSTTPPNDANGVAVDADITITFSEPVNLGGSWYTIECGASSSHTASASGGPTTFTLDPDDDFAELETCTVTVLADEVSDQDTDDPPDTMAADHVFSFTTAGDECAAPYTHIYQIQGDGMSAAITGNVTTQGVVVGDFEGPISSGIQGFYLQDVDGDDDATTYDGTTTSDGIFVFTGDNDNGLNAGDVVRVSGFARERFNQTALNGANNNNAAVTNIVDCGTTATVAPVEVTMPFESTTYLERFEGMLVTFPQALVISEYFNYDRFGEVVIGLPLPGESRHFTPTLLEEPGPDATARFNEYLLRRITLDDGLGSGNPSFTRHPNGLEFTLERRFRGGDTLQDAVGVLGFDFSLYRIHPTGPANYTAVNHRPAAPQDVGGRLKVAVMNTLNFYITPDIEPNTTPRHPDDEECGPLNNLECRGWDSNRPEEFDRQRDKLLAALAGLDADVIGVNEIENSTGVDPLADPQGIVPGLNAMFGPGTYASISTGTIGGDAIKVGLIYRPAAVTPVGDFRVLTSAVDPRFNENRSRPALAQTFRENATGEAFTVVVNHLKSKGSGCGAGDDDPSPGGAGSCNLTRTLAAQALVDWLATDPTGSGDPDFLIMGDLNAYAMEDPIDVIRAGADDTFGTADDYTNLIDKYLGSHAYSFVFDGMAGYLDHALSNPPMTAQVTGATEWHINADEPDLLDYDTSFKSDEQDELYESNAYRSSDHDPLIVGLNLAPNVGKVTGGGRFAGGSLDISVTFTTPTSGAGTTVVALNDGSTFEATAFEWFVHTGSTAFYAGTGTLDGNPGYGFLVSAFDGGKPKEGGDRVRVRIWDADGVAVYDSQPGAPLTAPPTSPVTGNLVIHKVK